MPRPKSSSSRTAGSSAQSPTWRFAEQALKEVFSRRSCPRGPTQGDEILRAATVLVRGLPADRRTAADRRFAVDAFEPGRTSRFESGYSGWRPSARQLAENGPSSVAKLRTAQSPPQRPRVRGLHARGARVAARRLRPASWRLIAALVAAAAASVVLFSGAPASASEACVAGARASADGRLSSSVTISVRCEADATVSVSLPGGDRAVFDVDGGEDHSVVAGRAYLCSGASPLAQLEANGPAYTELVPITGLGQLPACDVLLKPGVTEVVWAGPSQPIEHALAPLAPAVGSRATTLTISTSRLRAGFVPGLAVWASDEDAPWRWSGWGDGVPPALHGLQTLERGHTYLVVSDTERAWTFPPAPQRPSYFDDAQVVSFYGYPGVPVMGALGAYGPDEVAKRLKALSAEYDALNGPRGVIPAFHLIVAVAQATAQEDGTYLGRLEDDAIEAYVEAARRHRMLLFIDVQIGWSDPLYEVELLERFLVEPFVHLALDPEFATGGLGVAPGELIGSLAAEDVNRVQEYLAGLTREHGLPPKILVLHQFVDYMLLNRDQWDEVPEVELTVDMDGYGWDQDKLTKYDVYALQPASDRAAIKLFFDWDTPLLSPERLQALLNPPDLVIYQ